MYIAYRVENYIEGNKVSKNFAIWGQNDYAVKCPYCGGEKFFVK